MLDLKVIRENPERIDAALEARCSSWDKQQFLSLDSSRRSLITQEENLQARRNALSKEIGALMKQGKHQEAEQFKQEVQEINTLIEDLQEQRKSYDDQLDTLVHALPNVPHEDVPFGKDDTQNVEVRRWGTPRSFNFEPKAHWDLGTELNLMDFERAVKLSGARFVLLGGLGARLERALINFMIDFHVQAGFKEWWSPVIANGNTLFGTGQLPKFEEDLFHVDHNMYLIPTAEVMLTNIHCDEVLEAAELPKYYTAFTPCFREEAGSAGRDTRGLIRLHQFDKVEMVKFVRPEESFNELESMTNQAAAVLEALGLPYRIVTLCTGDLGFCSAKTYDLEVYLPSYQDYKEISSCSNCTDFQARRANIKYRDPAQFKGTRFVHTLNGSGLAVGRTMAALLENYQNEDGSVTIPEILRPYMGGLDCIRKGA